MRFVGNRSALNEDLAALPHPSHPQHKAVTLSIGATRFCAGQSAYSQIYQNADHALYDVKAAGRDSWRVVG
ncbi:diguanylate cyclase [Halomonas sp. TBZ9]|uniref:Diguanylate cyclase n=1 Tax=Vreelandella azerica TaxID=2732867 RepID=A0A7Y3X9W7_9GAMM|nr:diguanylate cyclase [Halomonas azerica]